MGRSTHHRIHFINQIVVAGLHGSVADTIVLIDCTLRQQWECRMVLGKQLKPAIPQEALGPLSGAGHLDANGGASMG
jgi:hypothetical protein